jgi:hypothetical protein
VPNAVLISVMLGFAWPWPSKLEIWRQIGRLPGDIVIRQENFSFYFPILTCIIVSAAASLLFWLYRR